MLGRTTYESIGRPLPDRPTIVLTRDPSWAYEGVLVASSVDEAIALGAGLDEVVMVGGGAQVYADALGPATEQVLSEVHTSPDGDALYPTSTRRTGSRPPASRPRERVRDRVAGSGSSAEWSPVTT